MKELSSYFLGEVRKFFQPKAAPADGGEEGEEAGPALETLPNVPDLLTDSKVYEWAGVGFGQ